VVVLCPLLGRAWTRRRGRRDQMTAEARANDASRDAIDLEIIGDEEEEEEDRDDFSLPVSITYAPAFCLDGLYRGFIFPTVRNVDAPPRLDVHLSSSDFRLVYSPVLYVKRLIPDSLETRNFACRPRFVILFE